MQVDTIGSGIDTVLAIYRNTNLLTLMTNPAAALVTCDNDSAPDGGRSLLRFAATSGTVYLAVVDGVNGSRGLAKINWRLGLAPSSSPPVTNVTTLTNGSALTLTAGTTGGIPPPVYQWRLNGTNLPGATSSNLVIHNLNPAMAGAYSVVVSNFAGVTTNLLATIAVHVPLHLENALRSTNRLFTFQVMGNVGQLIAVQASSDLEHWVTIHTNRLPHWQVPFTDTNAPQFNHRFYRVIPWLSLDAQAVRGGDIARFRIRGRSSQPFVLESCDSWTDWTPVYTNTLPDVPMDFLDPRPANTHRRIYKGRIL
jgi:Ig-like domain-containing protein